jgi:hypothetical protein
MYDEEDSRAIDAFNDAVTRAYQAWLQTRDELWPGWINMSPQMRAELGIPEPPKLKDRQPLPPRLDPSSPDFQPPWCLHPSMLSEEARARVQAQQAAITEAEAAVTAILDADFAAWEPEAEP